ncbi:ATP phosphoribosyltransferase [Chloroflexota bacterium]
MPIKVALPKGHLLRKTAALLQRADWGLDEYHSKLSFYHPKSRKFPELVVKVFHEKDIPIQVAVGNYDLGICSLDWLEELLVKYRSSALVKVEDLGYGRSALFMAASRFQTLSTLEQVKAWPGIIRIASEYPNLAESFALKNRLSWFSIFPVWGAADGYPPENAELALIAGKTADEIGNYGMVPVSKVLDCSAFLIANRDSWESKDLADVVNSISDALPVSKEPSPPHITQKQEISGSGLLETMLEGVVRLALPDGHHQPPTVNLLNKTRLAFDDYPSASGNRRPGVNLEGVRIKVIRPQDMPLQVANGNFDLAITGKDWLTEHLCQFPSSPVRQLLDLGYSRVKLVAVVSRELAGDDTSALRELGARQSAPLRIASEYVHIADRYARDNHLGRYRIVPTWGATEAFLPEDADLLIENTETGRTIARHNLKIIDTVFVSTACLIGNSDNISDTSKSKTVQYIIDELRVAVEETQQ